MSVTKKKQHPGKKGHPLRIPLPFEDLMESIVKVKPWRGMKKRASKPRPRLKTPKGRKAAKS